MDNKCTIFPLFADKRPACKGWKNYKGVIDTPIYGVKVPTGVLVIDVDSYKSTDSIEELQKKFEKILGVELKWNKAFIQKTLNGGYHYAFRVPETVNIPLGVDVLVKHIDTRVANKSYIACGKGYISSQKGAVIDILSQPSMYLPSLPEKALNKLIKGSTGNIKITTEQDLNGVKYDLDDDDLNVCLANELKCGLNNSEIINLINLLPDHYANDSDKWLKIGMAIYHETSGSEKGYDIFDSFSKKAPDKYNELVNKKRWESFQNQDKSELITFKSVIHMINTLKKENFNQISKNIKEVLSDKKLKEVTKQITTSALLFDDNKEELIRQVKKQTKSIQLNNSNITEKNNIEQNQPLKEFWEDYVFCQSQNKFIHKTTFNSMSSNAFDMTYTRFAPKNSKGVNIRADIYVKDKIDTVYDVEYNPLKKEQIFYKNNMKLLNTYRAFKHPYIANGTTNASKLIVEHVKWLIEDEKDQTILLSFIAHQVQRAGQLLRWGMILQGVSGNGKSFFANLLKTLLGAQHVGFISASQFSSKFNNWAIGNIVTVIEELKVGSSENKFDVVNHIKPLLTNESITIEGKGQNSKVATNVTNYFATSNYVNCIPLDAEDRRWVVIFTKPVCMQKFRKQKPNYFKDLFETIEKNGAELYDFFKNFEIPSWFYDDVDAIYNTSSKKKLLESNITIPEHTFLLALEEFNDDKHISKDRFINITYLNSVIADYKLVDKTYEDFPKYRFLTQLLRKYGYNTVTRPRVENYNNTGLAKQCVVYSKF